MAKYMLLIFGVDEQWEGMTPAQAAAHGRAHEEFRAAAGARVVGRGFATRSSPAAASQR